MRGSGGWPRESQGSPEPSTYAAEAQAIGDRFRRQLAGLRDRFQPWEMPAALRALQQQKDADMTALRERQAVRRHAERTEARRARAAERAARQHRPT